MGKAWVQARQQALPMELPPQAPEGEMRRVWCERWSRWHSAKTYEEAVADPVTARLLALTVERGRRCALG